MKEIQLQLPTIRHKEAAQSYKNEFIQNEEFVINGSALLDQMEFDSWLEYTTKNQDKDTVSKDWVVSDTFFAVRKSDSKIIGMIDIRHNLGNLFLKQYGGHIGYSVRPSERKKGYATEILRMALEYASTLTINEVMLGCYIDNIPSIKVIEKCGGNLVETKPYVDGKPMNVYWIDIQYSNNNEVIENEIKEK